MVIVAAIFSAAIIYNLISMSAKHIKNTESELKTIFIKRQKLLINKEIDRITRRIDLEQQNVYLTAKDIVRTRVISACDLLNHLRKSDMTAYTQDMIAHAIVHSYKWEYSSGYYFVLDKNGKVLHHGGDASLEGKNIFSAGISPELVTFLRKAYEKGEAYGEYSVTGKSTTLTGQKIAYAKLNKSTGLLIGASIDLDEITKTAQSNILSILKSDRYGFQNTGYFWVMSSSGRVIFHPDRAFYSFSADKLQDTDGRYLMKEAIETAKTKGAGFITYKWPEPGSSVSVDKVTYVKYIPHWDWIIATGFYFNDYQEITSMEKEVMQSTTKEDLYSNLIIITVLFVSTLLIASYVSRRLKMVETNQAKFINDLRQYKHVMDESSIVSMTDPSGRIVYVNDKFCEISGFTRDQLLGSRHNIMRHPDTPSELFKDLWTTILHGKTWNGIIKNLRNDGSHFYHKATIVPYKDENGKIISFTSCSQDVTEVMENREKLQTVFSTDRLTGLGNRYKLLKDVETSRMPSLAYIDVDRFHEINETYGMKAGDDILAMLAEKMKNSDELRMFDIYRVHSDVFAVLAPYIDQKSFVSKTMEGIEKIAAGVIELDGKEIVVSFRTGFASDLTDIVAKADIALQQAKNENKSYVIYDSSNIHNAEVYEQNIKIVRIMNEAIDKDKVVPHYQPIYNYDTGTIEKYECLIRIISEDGTVIPPSQFLEVSKQTRLYTKLTRIVASKSIDTFRNLPGQFSINLSVEDLKDQSTMDFIYDYGKSAGVLDRMVIEILETEQFNSTRDLTHTIERFKSAGTMIAIDDFGTGYSNFDYLLKVHADFIKIDGSIIKLITKDDRAVDIVNSIVRYAKKMGMKTIGEFISDRDIAKKAESLKIDYAQGYYFGKPEAEPKSEPDNRL